MNRVLFLCSGNSCRSILAEAILNHLDKDRFIAFSAGSFPTGKVHPMSLAMLKSHGIEATCYRSKSWDEFANKPIDIVITVCDKVAGESCPIFSGSSVKAHWNISDPVQFRGSETDVKLVFGRVYDLLEARIKALLRLPLEQMQRDEIAQKLRDIGALATSTSLESATQ